MMRLMNRIRLLNRIQLIRNYITEMLPSRKETTPQKGKFNITAQIVNRL